MPDAAVSRIASFSEYRRVLLALLMQPRLWQRPLYRAAALRQFNLIMAQSLTSLGLRAFILGFLLVAYVLVVVSADVQLAFKIFHIGLFREGGPLITAILLLLSQGTDTTSVLQTQRDRGELAWLHNLGLPWPHLLVLPRLLALTLACAVLTGYFQLFSLLGALLANALLGHLDVFELLQRALPLLQLDDMPYALLKALGFGLIIGCVATAHGLYDRQSASGSQRGSPASRALVSSFLLMSLFNLVVAYVFYGVLFYGLL
jgi:phospholipid/cholesterol/gamma-HCH transport system permease protein